MHKNHKLLAMVVTLLASAFIAKTSFAEEPQTASAQIGLALPLVGDLKDIADPGLTFGVQAMHKANATSRYGIGVSYTSFGQDDADGVETEVSMISTLAMTQHILDPKSSSTPFFQGGFGFTRTQVNIARQNAGGAAVERGSNQEDISPTILIGFGMDMPAAYNTTVGFSVDYQHFFFKVGDVSGGGTLNFNLHMRV